MAYLFIVQDKVVIPNPETLLLSPFKEIWKRDKNKKKDIATQEFTYIEFMSSFKKSNPFKDYPENKKSEIVKKNIIKEEKWEPDKLVLEGIEVIKKFQTEGSSTFLYFLSAKFAAEKLQEFFNTFDISERHWKTGLPVYKPKEITSALMDTERVLINLTNISKKVEEELFENLKIKADKKVSVFANPENFKI
jgi:hypothetical protein